MVIAALVLTGLVVTALGVVLLVMRLTKYIKDSERYENGPYDRQREKSAAQKPTFPKLLIPAVLILAGLLWTAATATGSAEVAPTEVGVIENRWNGTFAKLEPGTHIFPFQPRLVPFVTNVTHYSLRRQITEIGTPDPSGKKKFSETAVEAGSNSPGQPAVYYFARGWAYPNKEKIVELHIRYGQEYLDTWIEKVWIAILKSVQGKHPYSYVNDYRVDFQEEVEKELQLQLLDGDEPLVIVSQLAVVNFAYTDETESYLDSVQQVEFARRQAEQKIEVNRKQQDADRISAETSYIVETRNAERDRDANIARAKGLAEAVKLAADAEAYRIEQTYTAEAEGVGKVQGVLARSPEGYLEYQKNKQWDGKLPQYMLGGGSGIVPFVDVTPNKK